MSRRVVLLVSLFATVVAVAWWRGGGEPQPDVRDRFRPTGKASSAQTKRDRPPPRNVDSGAPAGAAANRPLMRAGRPEKMPAPRLDPVQPHAMNDHGAGNSGDDVEDAEDYEDPDAKELEKEIHTALEDPEPTNRAAAISNLGLSDDFGPVEPVLQRAAADPDPDVKLAVLEAMGNMGAAVPQNLVEHYAKDADPDIRLEALWIAEQLMQEDNPPAYVEPLLRSATSDPNEEVSDRAKEILEDGSENIE